MTAAVPVDVQTAGLVAANMLQCWIASERAASGHGAHVVPSPTRQDLTEGGADVESTEPPPREAGLRLCAAVDDGAGAPSSREHGAAVRPSEPGRRDDVGAGADPDPRPGSRTVGSADDRPRGLQDAGRRRVPGPGRRDLRPGSLAAGPLQSGMASVDRDLRADPDPCHRRGWLLRPRQLQDALLLGLKATIAHAELHVIRARLQGGKLNKARKGELRFPLPVGLCYAEEGRIVLDPDQEVQGAVRLVFDVFRQTGSAYAVVHRGSGCGSRCVPLDAWPVRIENHHDGYVSWQEFERNQQLLANNRTNAEHMLLSGAAREGHALLQGLLLCGRCGRRLSVRYKGNGGIYPTYDCNARRREGVATTGCMSLRCDLLDTAVSGRVLTVLQPAELEVAEEALRQLEHRDTAMSAQWRMRLERAEYEAQLAQRRYEEVDPSNRLVAATLEQRWNDALVGLEEIRTQFADFQREEALVVTPEQRARVAALAHDFPRLWRAPTTRAKDKKRILRLLIKDITVERFGERKTAVLHVRWQGGACEDLRVTLPANIADRLRYPDEVVDRVRELARERTDEHVAAALNREGRRSAKGGAFNASMVRWIRHKHRIPAPVFQRPGERSVRQVADELGVSRSVVYYWIDRGVLRARRRNNGSPYWITLDDDTKEALLTWVRNSSRI